MYMNAPEKFEEMQQDQLAILELLVKNHPGVMAHVCGLFSRRAYNLEGIAVLPIGDGRSSRIWLKVKEEGKLEQVIKQLEKLNDIKQVTRHTGPQSIFTEMEPYFQV